MSKHGEGWAAGERGGGWIKFKVHNLSLVCLDGGCGPEGWDKVCAWGCATTKGDQNSLASR